MTIYYQSIFTITIPLTLCLGFLVLNIVLDYTAPSYGQQQVSSSQAGGLAIENIPVQKAKVNDIEIAYKQFGNNSDRPIVLIAGAGTTMENMWSPTLLNHLSSSNRTVIIFDNRGVGQSTLGTRDFSITQFANDTAGLFDVLGVQKADILGYSMGSAIAQELALKNPNRVDNLILAASGCGGEEGIPPSPQTLPALAIMTNTLSPTEEQIDIVISTLFPPKWLEANPDFQNYFRNYLPLPSESVSPQIIKRQGEAIATWGLVGTCYELSSLTHPTGNAMNLAKSIPGAWLVQIRDAGHGLVHQYPDKFSRVVSTFLQTNS